MTRHQSFLSSTNKDLHECRAIALHALWLAQAIPVGMEYFGAHPHASWTVISRMIEQSDYFILLLGAEPGHIRTETGNSFVQDEMKTAIDFGKPVAVVDCRRIGRSADEVPVPVDAKQKQFWDEALAFQKGTAERLDQVEGQVLIALQHLKDSRPGGGWMRRGSSFGNELDTEGAFFADAAARIADATNSVLIYDLPVRSSNSWVFALLWAITNCRTRGLPVLVRAAQASKSFELLRELGCRIEIGLDGTPAFQGLVIDSDTDNMSVSYRLSAQQGLYGVYLGAAASMPLADVVASLPVEAGRYRWRAAIGGGFRPKLAVMPWPILEARLRRVSHYSSSTVKIDYLPVSLDKTRPQASDIDEVKIRQFSCLRRLYDEAGMKRFSPAMLTLQSGSYSPVVPPVVELQGDGSYRVAEGHTRLWHLREDKNASADVVVVAGCSPLNKVRANVWSNLLPSFDPDRRHGEPVHSRNLESLVHMRPDRTGLDFVTPEELAR